MCCHIARPPPSPAAVVHVSLFIYFLSVEINWKIFLIFLAIFSIVFFRTFKPAGVCGVL